MMRILPALALAALLSAGCVSQTTTTLPTADAKSAAWTTQSVSYQACAEQDASFPIPMDAAAAGLPAGFTPVPFAGDPSGKEATALVWTYACQTGAVEGAAQLAPGEMWGYLPVSAPKSLTNGTGFAMVLLGGFIQDEAATRLYHSWGLSAENLTNGFVNVAASGDETSAFRAGTADGGDGNFSVSVSATAAGLTSHVGGGVARVFVLGPRGTIAAAFDTSWTPFTSPSEGGHATVQFSGASETEMGLPTQTSGTPGLGSILSGIGYTNRLVQIPGVSTTATATVSPAAPAHWHLKTFDL